MGELAHRMRRGGGPVCGGGCLGQDSLRGGGSLRRRRPMANFNVRVPDEMAVRFDAWAAAEGGRSPALRHLIDRASAGGPGRTATPGRLPKRPEKLTVRLAADDAQGLD